MKIDRIRAFVVKIPYHDRFGGQTTVPSTLAGSDYYFASTGFRVGMGKGPALRNGNRSRS
jgi:hypothetical protein